MILWRRTFMRALESFPVHWLKLRPLGNRRRPGNAGLAAILERNMSTRVTEIGRNCRCHIKGTEKAKREANPCEARGRLDDIPSINVIQDTLCFSLCFCYRIDVFFNPCNEMIFERPFDELVKQIGCEELVNVGAWKVMGEWLCIVSDTLELGLAERNLLTVTSFTIPNASHCVSASYRSHISSVRSRNRGAPSWSRSCGRARHLT